VNEFDHAAGDVAIRDDLKTAHREIWAHVRAPGTWWTGAERVAMATEARLAATCALCAARKAALSPTSVAGTHDSTGVLPEAVVDIIHRVRTDPARLSREWFEQLVPATLSAPAYVEVIGVTALVSGVDFFARSLGVPATELPEPQAGEPSRYLPAHVRDDGAWVAMIAPEDATGPEADLYGDAPVVPNIVRALSLVPEQVRAMRRCIEPHYVPLERISDPSARRALDRAQIELVAARVSALNECFY
jgi:hypothetical protein